MDGLGSGKLRPSASDTLTVAAAFAKIGALPDQTGELKPETDFPATTLRCQCRQAWLARIIHEADLTCACLAFLWVGAVMEDLSWDLAVKALISALLRISGKPQLELLVLGPWKHA